jgi:hypothetical protein
MSIKKLSNQSYVVSYFFEINNIPSNYNSQSFFIITKIICLSWDNLNFEKSILDLFYILS